VKPHLAAEKIKQLEAYVKSLEGRAAKARAEIEELKKVATP
jgi:hypothetical protein